MNQQKDKRAIMLNIRHKQLLRRYTTCLLAFVLILPYSLAQPQNHSDRLNFFYLSRIDGLSDNNVSAIAKDHKGYIWIGTTNGLNRFNGYDFRVYRTLRNDSTSLPGNNIADIAIDHDGTLWVGLFPDGVARYNEVTDNFQRYSLATSYDDLRPNEVQSISIDSDNNVWVTTPVGLFCLNRQDDIFERIETKPIPTFNDSNKHKGNSVFSLRDDILRIAPDPQGGSWVVYSDLSLSYLHPPSNSSIHYSNLQLGKGVPQKTSIVQTYYHKGQIFVATENHGLLSIDLNNLTINHLIDPETLRNPTDIHHHNGTLWISSFNGLFRFNLETQTITRYINRPGDSKSLRATATNVVFVDNLNLLWVGTANFGVNYSNIELPFNQIIEDINDPYMLSQPRVNALHHDKKGNLWAGYQSGNIDMITKNGRVSIQAESFIQDAGVGAIFSFLEDSKGDLYMSSWLGGLQKFNNKTKQFHSTTDRDEDFEAKFHGVDVRAVEEDSNENLWLIIHGQGLIQYNRKTNKTTLYGSTPEDPGTLSNAYIFSMCLDDDDNIWAPSPWGTNRLNINDSIVKRYFATADDDSSILSNSMELAFKDSMGRVWLCGNEGLSLYNPESDNFHNILLQDFGLGHLTLKSIQDDAFGNLWVSSSHGIVWINLNNTDPFSPTVSNIFLYDVTHGILSEDFFPNASAKDQQGNIYFGGTSGIDYFNPKNIINPQSEMPIIIEEVKLFDSILRIGSPNGPKVNSRGEVVLSYNENMLSFKFVSLNYIDIHRNNYLYKLEPLDEVWHSTGKERNVTFANLPPGSYNFRVKSCFGIDDCDANDASLAFVIKPPFWRTNLFVFLTSTLFIALTIALIMLWTANIRRKKDELERIVSSRTAELSKLNTMKDKLFSIIAHDLKNPFGNIMGLTDLIEANYAKYGEEKRREIINHINSSAKETFILLENLLQWARSQSQQIVVRAKPQSLYQLADETENLIKKSFETKWVTLTNNIEPGTMVWGDSELIKIILRNLLTNALKFTPTGGHVSIESSHQNNTNTIRIDVTDTGVGINTSIKESIFSMDNFVVSHGTEGEHGTGLGLSICKEFVIKMGGTIWVDNTSPKGTTISFTLPAAG